jgi:PAS domain S-box-containing protein
MTTTGFKSRIMISVAAMLCVLFAGFLYGVWSLQEYHLRRCFSDRLKSSQRILKEHGDTDVRVLAIALDGLCSDEKMQSLWLQRDRTGLEEYAQPLFKNLGEQYSITHFYFIEPTRMVFLRVHQPDRHGDLIKRRMVLQAQKSGCVESGIELGSSGTLTLRVVKPWVIDGNVAGYLELGEDVTHITKAINSTLDVGVAILLDKTHLDRDVFERGMAMHDRASNWNDFPGEVVVNSDPSDIPQQMLSSESVLRDNSLESAVEFERDGNFYVAGAVRLREFSGNDVGRMVLIEDVTPQHASLRLLMFKLGKFFFLIGAACLLGVFAYLMHIEKLVNRSHQRVLHAHEAREAAQAKHIEETLQFRTAIECATDAIAILSVDRQLQFVNPAFEKLFGLTMEEVTAQGGIRSLYCDQKFAVKIYLVVSQGRSFSGEVEMHAGENRVVHTVLRASPIFNADRQMIGVIAIYTDLSERKSIERELLRQSLALVETNQALVEAKGGKGLAQSEHA